MEVIVQDANNIVIEVDQGRQGRGVEDVSLITVGADYYLLFTFTDGTTDQVGPIATTVTEVISAEVRNAEAVTILKGQPVYLYQAQGNLATVKLAYNTSDATSAKTLGLAAENIAPNAQGLITCQGTLGGLNTSAYNEGDTLYLGATAGTLTNVKPQAPNHLVYIGVVERANAGAGQIYVRVQNGFELDEIHDVRIISPVNGNTLIYDAATDLWKNAGITAGSGISVTNGPASITVGNTGVLSFSGGTTGLTPATATTGAVTLAGTLSTANGGTGLSSFTANRVLYTSSTSAIGQSANLTFDGTNLTAAGSITGSNATTSFVTDATNGFALFTGDPLNYNISRSGTNVSVKSAGSVTLSAGSTSPVTFNIGGSEQMRLTSTGLGIGTSSPGARLDVSGTVAGVLAAQIVNLSSSSSAIARLRLDSLGGAWLIDNNRVDGSLTIGNGSERLRVGSTGNLLVGTTTNTNSSTVTAGGTISETVSSVQYLVASQFDVGTAPNKIPLNQYLGNLAYQNASAIAGQAGFSAGTAALPSIASATDLTTGRWFPAAGVMAWSTSGVERMRLDASGNLGVGTSNPITRLQTVSSGTTVGGASGVVAGFFESNIAVGSCAKVVFGSTDGAVTPAHGAISGVREDVNASSVQGGLAFFSRPVAGSLTERMRLDSSGNLGLGVTPSAWQTGYKAIDFGLSGGLFSNGSSSAGGFTAVTANTYYDGAYKYKNTDVAGMYRFVSGIHSWHNAPSGTAGTAISFTQAMTLDASGNLALGATSASYRLDITAATGGNGVIAVRAGANQNSTLSLAGNASTPSSGSFDLIQDQTQAYVYQRANQPLLFGTNNTERARITGTGNVIVGTAAIATTATDGFLYIPTCAGAPTGTPTAQTGRAPLVVDSTNNRFYVYVGGAWKYAALV